MVVLYASLDLEDHEEEEGWEPHLLTFLNSSFITGSEDWDNKERLFP